MARGIKSDDLHASSSSTTSSACPRVHQASLGFVRSWPWPSLGSHKASWANTFGDSFPQVGSGQGRLLPQHLQLPRTRVRVPLPTFAGWRRQSQPRSESEVCEGRLALTLATLLEASGDRWGSGRLWAPPTSLRCLCGIGSKT